MSVDTDQLGVVKKHCRAGASCPPVRLRHHCGWSRARTSLARSEEERGQVSRENETPPAGVRALAAESDEDYGVTEDDLLDSPMLVLVVGGQDRDQAGEELALV